MMLSTAKNRVVSYGFKKALCLCLAIRSEEQPSPKKVIGNMAGVEASMVTIAAEDVLVIPQGLQLSEIRAKTPLSLPISHVSRAGCPPELDHLGLHVDAVA